MKELKEKMNTLATSYNKITEAREKNDRIKVIKALLKGFVRSMRKKFKLDDLRRIDYESVANIALLKALNGYNENNGNFDTYYGIWIRSEVTREIINHVPNVKLPEYLSKPLHRIIKEKKYHITNPDDKDKILYLYNISEADYNKIVHYCSLSKHLESLFDGVVEGESERTDLEQDILRALKKEFTPRQIDIVCKMFGIAGHPEHSKSELRGECSSEEYERLVRRLRESKKLKRALKEYNEPA